MMGAHGQIILRAAKPSLNGSDNLCRQGACHLSIEHVRAEAGKPFLTSRRELE